MHRKVDPVRVNVKRINRNIIIHVTIARSNYKP